jgi:hypothetical protein
MTGALQHGRLSHREGLLAEKQWRREMGGNYLKRSFTVLQFVAWTPVVAEVNFWMR